jgi:hypothetical protein
LDPKWSTTDPPSNRRAECSWSRGNRDLLIYWLRRFLLARQSAFGDAVLSEGNYLGMHVYGVAKSNDCSRLNDAWTEVTSCSWRGWPTPEALNDFWRSSSVSPRISATVWYSRVSLLHLGSPIPIRLRESCLGRGLLGRSDP